MFKVIMNPNIRTHLIRAVPELAQERVETATRVLEEHEGRMSRPVPCRVHRSSGT